MKNAYDPQFTVDGKYDEKAAQAAESLGRIYLHDAETAGTGIKTESTCTTIRTAGVPTNRCCTIRWIAGLSALLLARTV